MIINSLSFAKANQISYLGMSYDSALERYDSSCILAKKKKLSSYRELDVYKSDKFKLECQKSQAFQVNCLI